jgi:hypothetical protein
VSVIPPEPIRHDHQYGVVDGPLCFLPGGKPAALRSTDVDLRPESIGKYYKNNRAFCLRFLVAEFIIFLTAAAHRPARFSLDVVILPALGSPPRVGWRSTPRPMLPSRLATSGECRC